MLEGVWAKSDGELFSVPTFALPDVVWGKACCRIWWRELENIGKAY